MKWIDVNDDLPPSYTRVLVNAYLCHDSEVAIIVDAFWDPAKGWRTQGHKNHIDCVLHWHPLCELPPDSDNTRQHSSAECPIVCETRDDSQ
jgi:hypothetical protein